MKGLIILFFGLLIAETTIARQHTTDTSWYNMQYTDKVVSTKDSADYYLAILPANNEGTYPIFEYNKEHKLISTGFSTTPQPGKLKYTGVYTNFNGEGKKTTVADYDNGILSGKIIEYYPNGQLYTYRIHPKNGHVLLVECRDSTGKILAKDGNGRWVVYTDNFHKIGEEGMVKDSLEDGKWIAEITNEGKFATVYNHGQKISVSNPLLLVTHDEVFERVEIEPYYPDFGRFLSENIRYPKYDKEHNIQGKVFVQFVVDRDGSLVDIRVLRSPDETLANEAVRVLHACGKWHPGYQDDHAVRVMYTVPISFTLSTQNY